LRSLRGDAFPSRMSETVLEPTILVDRYEAEGPRLRHYRDLPIYAYEEIHLTAAEVARDYFAPGGKVLDLGAGAGALSLRLADAGFAVTAFDYAADNFRLHGHVPFVSADLNGDFAESVPSQSVDAVIAVEIVEHLENPRHLVRQAMQALKPGGYLFLTTPNVDSCFSLLSQLRHGHPDLFNEECYRADGHITPVSAWVLRHAVAELGMETVFCRSFGKHPPQWWKYRAAMWLLRRFAGDKAFAAGSTVGLLARKPPLA
jgi:SAM-dependent methyltransferase